MNDTQTQTKTAVVSHSGLVSETYICGEGCANVGDMDDEL